MVSMGEIVGCAAPHFHAMYGGNLFELDHLEVLSGSRYSNRSLVYWLRCSIGLRKARKSFLRGESKCTRDLGFWFPILVAKRGGGFVLSSSTWTFPSGSR
jgi:hypothetical protein